MNAEQKKQAAVLLQQHSDDVMPHHVLLSDMAALLQELVDALAPEPVARVTGYYGGYLSIATVDGRVLPAGTALYAAPPAPSVPDGWRYVIPGRRRTEKFDSPRDGDYNQGWNACREATEKALNDLEKRK